MRYWLLKTEPEVFSWRDLTLVEREPWDGVKNFAALKNMSQMRPGDLALIYHTGKERAAKGIADVVSEPYPDPKEKDPRWIVVDVSARELLERPVTLSEIKQDPEFSGWDLIRLPRLSVMEVPEALWRRILEMSTH